MGYKHTVKIILLGGNGVGKTAIFRSYESGSPMVWTTSTIGVDFTFKSFFIGSDEIRLQLWDTPGFERFDRMIRPYLSNAYGGVICIDVMNSNSLVRAKQWLKHLEGCKHCKVYLCLTKKDLINSPTRTPQVSRESIQAITDELAVKVFETSSLTGENIEEMFIDIMKDYAQDCSLTGDLEPCSANVDEANGDLSKSANF